MIASLGKSLLWFSTVCGMGPVCHGLFAFLLCVIGRLCSVLLLFQDIFCIILLSLFTIKAPLLRATKEPVLLIFNCISGVSQRFRSARGALPYYSEYSEMSNYFNPFMTSDLFYVTLSTGPLSVEWDQIYIYFIIYS